MKTLALFGTSMYSALALQLGGNSASTATPSTDQIHKFKANKNHYVRDRVAMTAFCRGWEKDFPKIDRDGLGVFHFLMGSSEETEVMQQALQNMFWDGPGVVSPDDTDLIVEWMLTCLPSVHDKLQSTENEIKEFRDSIARGVKHHDDTSNECLDGNRRARLVRRVMDIAERVQNSNNTEPATNKNQYDLQVVLDVVESFIQAQKQQVSEAQHNNQQNNSRPTSSESELRSSTPASSIDESEKQQCSIHDLVQSFNAMHGTNHQAETLTHTDKDGNTISFPPQRRFLMGVNLGPF